MNAAVLGLAAQGTVALAAPLFHLPSGYMGRLGSSEIAYTTETGFGVRYLPLPTDPDIRLSVVKQANYWEVNLGSRVNDTTLAGGVYFNGYAAAGGIPRMELTHNPAQGLQGSALIQGSGLHSHLSAGYAASVLDGRGRVLGTLGVATQADVIAPYAQTEVAASYGKAFGVLNTYVGVTARAYAFPVQGQAQSSVDLTLAASASPVAGLTLTASHFERFVGGTVAIPDFAVGRYEASTLGATYRLPPRQGRVSVGALRARAVRDWTGHYTDVWGDVFLDVNGLPSLIGPAVGYQFGPAGQGRWLVTVVSLPR